MSVALRGNLKDFGVGEVFQLIGQQRKTGVLEVSSDGERIQLQFDGGAVVQASPVGAHDHAGLGEMLVRCGLLTPDTLEELERERTTTGLPLPKLVVNRQLLGVPELEAIEDLLTQETIFTLLRREGGSFHFTAQPVAHDRESGSLLGAEQILMDGLRMVDEWRSFEDAAPTDGTVFQRTGSFDRMRAQATGESSTRLAAAERMFLLIDGRLTVRRVIDLSRLGTFEATRWLVRLARAGLVTPLDRDDLERARASARAVAPPPSPLAGVVALVAPFALALALLGLAAFAPRPGGPSPSLRAPLAEARAAFELRRVRNALDAWREARALTGESLVAAEDPLSGWPGSLEVLVRDGFLPPEALATLAAGPYYYARRAEGAEVLGPAHEFAHRAAPAASRPRAGGSGPREASATATNDATRGEPGLVTTGDPVAPTSEEDRP